MGTERDMHIIHSQLKNLLAEVLLTIYPGPVLLIEMTDSESL